MSDQGLMPLGTWENGAALQPNGGLGRVVIRNIKLWNKQKSLVLDVLFLHIDVWTLGRQSNEEFLQRAKDLGRGFW